jgi:hypothetical protein
VFRSRILRRYNFGDATGVRPQLLDHLVQACHYVLRCLGAGDFAERFAEPVVPNSVDVRELDRPERTLSWLVRCRRLARDYERLPEHSEAMAKWAMIGLMTRRPAPAPGRRPWQPHTTK